jgi:hypothetical protein
MMMERQNKLRASAEIILVKNHISLEKTSHE